MTHALTLALALLLAGCSYRCNDSGEVEIRRWGNDFWTYYVKPEGGCRK